MGVLGSGLTGLGNVPTAGEPPNEGGGGGQDPAHVNITGGSIVGVNTATRTVQGAMSPADKAFLDDFEGWQKTQYTTMIAAIPNLTGFKAFPVGVSPFGFTGGSIPAPGLDPNIEGGGLTANNATVQLGTSIFQNMPGGNVAFFFRAKIPSVATVGDIGVCGVSWLVGVNTATIFMGCYNSQDTSHYILLIASNAALNKVLLSTPFDGLTHDFGWTDDGTTIKGFVDGAQAGSTATRTNLVTAPFSPMFQSSSANKIAVSAVAYGYMK